MKKVIKSSRKPIVAEEVVEEPIVGDLLFEVEDVAELLAEVTGEDVEMEVDDETLSVNFAIGDDVYTVEAEGTEEVVTSAKKSKPAPEAPAKKPVSASRRISKIRK